MGKESFQSSTQRVFKTVFSHIDSVNTKMVGFNKAMGAMSMDYRQIFKNIGDKVNEAFAEISHLDKRLTAIENKLSIIKNDNLLQNNNSTEL